MKWTHGIYRSVLKLNSICKIVIKNNLMTRYNKQKQFSIYINGIFMKDSHNNLTITKQKALSIAKDKFSNAIQKINTLGMINETRI